MAFTLEEFPGACRFRSCRKEEPHCHIVCVACETADEYGDCPDCQLQRREMELRYCQYLHNLGLLAFPLRDSAARG